MAEDFIDKAARFIDNYRSLLIALGIAIGLFNTYLILDSEGPQYVDGYSCSYWDAVRNQNQRLIESELLSGVESSSLNLFTQRRDEAADKFNENCLPDWGYVSK